MGDLRYTVTFYGVRGSTPCGGPHTTGFGGNTSCVAVESASSDPIVFDLGTGLRYFGASQPMDGTFRGSALVSHLHWDHIQGLPFFAPVLRDGARLDLYGPPPSGGMTLEQAFERFMCDPFFPVGIADLPGHISFNELDDETRDIGGFTVMTRAVPHIGRTNGYRLSRGGAAMAYIPDHQQPIGVEEFSTVPGVLELCDGVDLLVHDAQFTPAEFAHKAHWGHCTIEYACWLAREAGVRRLALFHHDPSHNDEQLGALVRDAQDWGERHGIEVIGASEGSMISLGSPG
ncbi:MAG: MBL fold metallo-hydrolase [Acidimicrobiia bacterium]